MPELPQVVSPAISVDNLGRYAKVISIILTVAWKVFLFADIIDIDGV